MPIAEVMINSSSRTVNPCASWKESVSGQLKISLSCSGPSLAGAS